MIHKIFTIKYINKFLIVLLFIGCNKNPTELIIYDAHIYKSSRNYNIKDNMCDLCGHDRAHGGCCIDIEKFFSIKDFNSNNGLSIQEFYKHCNPSFSIDQTKRTMFNAVDFDKNGEISKKELYNYHGIAIQ